MTLAIFAFWRKKYEIFLGTKSGSYSSQKFEFYCLVALIEWVIIEKRGWPNRAIDHRHHCCHCHCHHHHHRHRHVQQGQQDEKRGQVTPCPGWSSLASALSLESSPSSANLGNLVRQVPDISFLSLIQVRQSQYFLFFDQHLLKVTSVSLTSHSASISSLWSSRTGSVHNTQYIRNTRIDDDISVLYKYIFRAQLKEGAQVAV